MNRSAIVKRIFDLIFSIIGIVCLFPVMVIITVAIKVDSKGPLLFKQARLGRYGKEFIMLKFRTMIVNAEFIGTGLYNYKDDFRVTKVGKLLRITSMDEIPQLFNILKGEMSFVGPRPPVAYELNVCYGLGGFDNLTSDNKKRFSVLPGITGLAQINGRNELSWDDKVIFDNEYIDRRKTWGLLLDLKIIVLTITKVLSTKDIYEKKINNKPSDSNCHYN